MYTSFKRNVLILGFIAIGIFSATPALASQVTDQRCFTAGQCIEQRSKFVFDSEGQGNAGFVQNDETVENCEIFAQDNGGEEVGYCLAGGNIQTTYSFFGKNDFVSIGDFIRHIYTVSIYVAMTLAVIMLIVSGIQRMTASGNSAMVEASTKRIIGAISGLGLLAFSFVILNQINPALVNLQQPAVFMVNNVALSAITTADGATICDPDQTAAQNACSTTEVCAPIETGIDMPACQIAAVAAIVGVPTIAGLAELSIAATAANLSGAGTSLSPHAFASGLFGRMVSALISRGSAVLKRIALPARLRVPGAQIFQGAAVSKFNLAHIGGRLWLQGFLVNGAIKTTNEVSEITGVGTAEIKDFFENEVKGICVEKITGNFQAGAICNTTLSECGNGLTCIGDPVIQGNLACWTGESNLGFCSSGNDGAICNSDSDCSAGNRCIDLNRPGTVADGKRCTSGNEGAYCNDNVVNASGDADCSIGFTCLDNICTSFAAQNEFDACQTDANCSSVTGRGSYGCYSVDERCDIQPVSNDLGNTVGLCLKLDGSDPFDSDRMYESRTTGDRHYKYPTRMQGGSPNLEDGGGGTTYSLVWQMLDEFYERNIQRTINLNQCASNHTGGPAIRSHATSLIEYYTETANHIFIWKGKTFGSN